MYHPSLKMFAWINGKKYPIGKKIKIQNKSNINEKNFRYLLK